LTAPATRGGMTEHEYPAVAALKAPRAKAAKAFKSKKAVGRISATRAIKNARHLQKIAPHIIPATEPAEGYVSLVPIHVLAHLHRPERRGKLVMGGKLAEQVKTLSFPVMSSSAVDPLFNGTLFFVRILFTIKSQNNAIKSVSAADMTTAVNYATQAVVPISRYSAQYGANTIAVSPGVITVPVTLQNPSYNDAQLQSWVNSIVSQNKLPPSCCVVVLNPQGVTNTDGDPAQGIGGYHGKANVPYCFVNMFGTNINVADPTNKYAMALSHEIAEMAVDPLANLVNPEVCDPCGPNCQTVFIDYFDNGGNYIATTQTLPPSFGYNFYINGIVKPASARACPAPATSCNYSPPKGVSLMGAVSAGRNADGRLELFGLGQDTALWHIWQTAPNNGWSGWSSLGGRLTSDPAVANNQDGRLEAFARGRDNALWHIWQTKPNNGWSGWASLGGVITSDPAVTCNKDGRLEVFARGTDKALWHIWQTAPHAGPWSSWASLGGIITTEPMCGRDQDGRLEVFARGTDNALWHIWQTAPNNGWSSWATLGGVITSVPIVTNDADGRLEVFARGTDRALWHIWQTAPNNGWSSWATLGGVLFSL
jgi:acylphosphatase